MVFMRYRTLLACLLALSLLSLAACGDDEGESANDDDPANQTANNSDPDDDDCEEGQQPNPITGECIDVSDNNDDPNTGDNGQDNGDDNTGQPNNDDPGDNDTPNGGDQNNGDNNGDNGDSDECGDSGLSGQTCRPDDGPLPGATVTIEGFDCDGAPFSEETTADGEGFYDFENIPSGTHTITISSGSFEVEDEVETVVDQVTDLTAGDAKVCLAGTEVNIAVMEGNFDDLDELLDNMGIEYDFYSAGAAISQDVYDFVTDLDEMNQYDIIFAECQVTLPRSGQGYDQDLVEFNINRFVEEGGSFYASDRADEWIYESMPDIFHFESDTGLGGASADPVYADAVSDAMQLILDDNSMEFQFDTNGWTIVSGGVDPDRTTTHFNAPVVPTGGSNTFEDASLITTYNDPLNDGTVVFTSFHNSAQADDEMEAILEHLIFQL